MEVCLCNFESGFPNAPLELRISPLPTAFCVRLLAALARLFFGLHLQVKIACAENAVDELPVENAQNLIAGLQKRLRGRSLGRRTMASACF